VYPVLGISLEHHLNYFTLDAFIAGDPRKCSVDLFGNTKRSIIINLNKTQPGVLSGGGASWLWGQGFRALRANTSTFSTTSEHEPLFIICISLGHCTVLG
jgi:hypothetical protein